QVLAAIRPDQDLETLVVAALDRVKPQFLAVARVEDYRLQPAQAFLAPGAQMHRLAVPAVADRHGTPDAQALRARRLWPGVQVRQAEHMAELVRQNANRR